MINISTLTDEALVKAVCQQNKELFAEIIKRYQTKLLRYAAYLVVDKTIAADVVQESLVKAYMNLNGFNLNKKFSSWMYRIVHNQAMNVLKKQKKQVVLTEHLQLSSGEDIENEYIEKQLLEHIRGCLDQLPLFYREPLTLFYLEKQSYETISDILKIPMGTVATRINRAKKTMKNICQKNK